MRSLSSFRIRLTAATFLCLATIGIGGQVVNIVIPEAAAVNVASLLKVFSRASNTIGHGVGSGMTEIKAALKFRAEMRGFRIADDLQAVMRAQGHTSPAGWIRFNPSHNADDVSTQLGTARGAVVNDHEVYAAIPRTEGEFRGVFGASPSVAEVGQVQAARKLLVANNIKTTVAHDTDFPKFLAESRSQLISIIGHNEGGVLKISEGVSHQLSDLVKACVTAGKICVFFSCRAQDHFRAFKASQGLGARFDLTFREATQAVTQLDKYMANAGAQGVNLDVLVPKIPEIVEGALANARITSFVEVAVVTTTAGGSAGGLFVYLDSKPIQVATR